MKVAIELSGEVRSFEHPLVVAGFDQFVKPLGADVFLSVWRHQGQSFYTRNFCLSDRQPPLENLEQRLGERYQPAMLEVEDYNAWFDALHDDLAAFLTSYSALSSSAPQIYKIFKASIARQNYQLMSGKSYDVVIRMRPDYLFIDSFDFSNFKPGTIFHTNFGTPGAYFPNRVYDVLFYGGAQEMQAMAGAWPNYVNLLRDRFENGLDRKDACRLLYIQAMQAKLTMANMPRRIGDVFRSDSTLEQFKAELQGWGMTA